MKILHILNHSFPLLDGYSSRSQNIFKAQRKMGWAPVILTSPKHEEDWKKDCGKKEIIDGFCFYRSGANFFKNLPIAGEIIQMLMVLLKLIQVIKAEKPVLLHAHSPVLNALPALLAGKWFHLPVVYEIRAFWEDAGVDQSTYREKSFKYELVKRIETWICKQADQVAVLCEGLKKDLAGRGIDPGKMTPVFNGINLENFKPCPPDKIFAEKWNLSDKKIIGFIGSFYRYEGLDLLIEAFAKIASDHDDLVLLLVGGGEMEEELKGLVNKLRLNERVIMPGRVPHNQVQGIYALIHILIYPRYSVRLTELVTPLKPLEAMAMEKVVVASNIGGHRELVSHNKTGLLFQAGNVTDLSESIVTLLEDPALAERLISHGMKYVTEHRTWEQTLSVYGSLYSRLLAA